MVASLESYLAVRNELIAQPETTDAPPEDPDQPTAPPGAAP
jgi:hypothetical protein